MTGAELRVDLDVLAANIAAVRARVAPAALMLVVKDDAYGLGIPAVVARAQQAGVTRFGAFDVVTGSAVRAVAGPEAQIFAWQTTGPDGIRRALRDRIDLGVGDRDFLTDIAGVARAEGIAARVHLKIDTGLHRNGIRPEDWPDAVAEARRMVEAGLIEIEGVWSHIAEASDAEDDLSRAVFDRAVQQASDAGLRVPLRHLAASAAAFARPEFRYDAVRIGAFCYGVRSADGPHESALGLRSMATLVAPVAAVVGDTVTVGIGALDGLPSNLAGRMPVHTPAGRRTVRAIHADRIEVEGWPGAAIGDEVTVLGGPAASATDLGELIDTVGEEILTRVSPRIARVYC